MYAFVIYIIGLADEVHFLLSIVPFLAFITLFGIGVNYFVINDSIIYSNEDEVRVKEKLAKNSKAFKVTLAAILICCGLKVAIPKSTTIAAMIIVPKIIENEHINNIAGGTLTVLEELIKKWALELKGKGTSL